MTAHGDPAKHVHHGLSFTDRVDASCAVWCSRCGIVATWTDIEEAAGVGADVITAWRAAVEAS